MVLVLGFGIFACTLLVFYSDFTKQIGKPIRTTYAVTDPAFANSLGGLLGSPVVGGNRFQTLVNGDQIFPAMLEAMAGAKKSITLESYIWESGEIGSKFVKVLSERARAGVVVLVIVDGMGTLKMEKSDMEEMKSAGARFVKYGRDRWYKIKANLNHRTHRKLLVVDGEIGFTGGVCIADKWMGDATSHELWRDTHFRIEGPVVGQLQGIFADNWLQTTGEVIHGEIFFPSRAPGAGSAGQCYKSGPRDGQESARLVHLYAIAAARKNIRLQHAYFVPDKLAIQALLEALKRGVTVQIIVPGKNDSAIGRAASRSTWGKLIEAGAEFYEYKPSLFHCKVMIVDDYFVTAGSVNFDNRSFRLNDEANFNVFDEKFAAEQVKVFEEDKKLSSRIDPKQFKNRSWYVKVCESCAGLFQSQL